MRARLPRAVVLNLGAAVLDLGAVGVSANSAPTLNEMRAPSVFRSFANAANVAHDEAAVPSGTIDDGAERLPEATITLDQAIAAVQGAATGRDEALRFLAALRMVRPATTLGDVYSLVLYPAMSTHRDLSPQERAAAGIGNGLLRLSVGIEDVADILVDLDQALDAV